MIRRRPDQKHIVSLRYTSLKIQWGSKFPAAYWNILSQKKESCKRWYSFKIIYCKYFAFYGSICRKNCDILIIVDHWMRERFSYTKKIDKGLQTHSDILFKNQSERLVKVGCIISGGIYHLLTFLTSYWRRSKKLETICLHFPAKSAWNSLRKADQTISNLSQTHQCRRHLHETVL